MVGGTDPSQILFFASQKNKEHKGNLIARSVLRWQCQRVQMFAQNVRNIYWIYMNLVAQLNDIYALYIVYAGKIPSYRVEIIDERERTWLNYLICQTRR